MAFSVPWYRSLYGLFTVDHARKLMLSFFKKKPPKGNNGKINLIWHVGAGKTGTSSIQYTLHHNQQLLEKQGFKYLGLMLEGAYNNFYSWQKPALIEEFHNLTAEETENSLHQIFQDTIENARRNGIHTLIWSNESFLGRIEKTRGALKKIEELGVTVRIVVYIRQYEKWAKSAYIQWGINHKTNPGRIIPFREWIQRRKVNFFELLKPIIDDAPESLTVRNMDAVGDTTRDFLKLCHIDFADMAIHRIYESPALEEIYLRAVFNNRIEDPVLPDRFDSSIRKYLTLNSTPDQFLQKILPDNEDLQFVSDLCKQDRDRMNEYLENHGLDPIASDGYATDDPKVNTDIILQTLTEIVMAQALRIGELEKKMNNIP